MNSFLKTSQSVTLVAAVAFVMFNISDAHAQSGTRNVYSAPATSAVPATSSAPTANYAPTQTYAPSHIAPAQGYSSQSYSPAQSYSSPAPYTTANRTPVFRRAYSSAPVFRYRSGRYRTGYRSGFGFRSYAGSSCSGY